MLYGISTDDGVHYDAYIHFIKRSKTIIIEHEKSYSEEEFSNICSQAFEQAKEKYDDPFDNDQWIVTEDGLIDVLCNQHGFKRPILQAYVYMPKEAAGTFDHTSDMTIKGICIREK